ncbi:MAG: hypothetical protein H6713_28900 [Myxococcales bacterium]|nr:hypothetical protein [Myxococcales bacterium]
MSRAIPLALSLTPALVLSLALGCLRVDAFTCAQDGECGADGVCEEDGSCSFPDDECPSGKRYGDYAAAELAGACVAGQAPDSTSATTTSETTGATTSVETGPGCGELGDACGGDDDCCSECMACEAGQCVAREGERGPCGECQACDAAGACADQASGDPCDADCTRYLWGAESAEGLTSCHRLADGVAEGTCDDSGLCVASDPSTCPEAQGEVYLACSDRCLALATSCSLFAPAASLSLASYCALEQQTALCTTTCEGDAAPEVAVARCDAEGLCVVESVEACFPYACDGNACAADCMGPVGCAADAKCTSGVCAPN